MSGAEESTLLETLHERYQVQARWTRAVRERWLQDARINQATRILEVGSGTGAIIGEISPTGRGMKVGLDLDPWVTSFSAAWDPSTRYAIGDGTCLPFPANAFDIVFCHFLLLWTSDPVGVVNEMVRSLCRGGWLFVFAEPDYGGRIDHPASLIGLGELQARALREKGADPRLGRQVGTLLHEAGLDDVEFGILGGEWDKHAMRCTWDSEWQTLISDLEGMLPRSEIQRWRAADLAAVEDGSRVIFVPTFYARGRKSMPEVGWVGL